MANIGCARPTGATVVQTVDEPPHPITESQQERTTMIRAQVGKPAPDFEAPAYYKGEFTSVKLSEHVAKGWTLLCFYPGDFTYV